jgi:DNA-binding transcriptional LysR family regulator
MDSRRTLQQIDLYLLTVLHQLLIEKNLSKVATRLESTQPAMSAALKRLRDLTGDELLVKFGREMVLTEFAQSLLDPVTVLLEQSEKLFRTDQVFNPLTTDRAFRIATSDYLDPLFLPRLIVAIKRAAPNSRIEVRSLNMDVDYREQLGNGTIDLVVSNLLSPPEDLHRGVLLNDEVVCLVAKDHPLLRGEATIERYIRSEHIAPMPVSQGTAGVVDDYLASQSLQRSVNVYCPYFSLIPAMVADSLLVLTTGRRFCSRFVQTLPVEIVTCPVKFPPMTYYTLWHDRVHQSDAHKWLRALVKQVAGDYPVVA